MYEKFLKEDLLQYLWRIGNFDVNNLKTTDSQDLKILDRGVHNHDSGPDFLNAKIKIGHTLWAGNVEIHKYSSDWLKHKHDRDLAYENVILHVVFKEDKQIENKRGEKIPCLELYNRMSTQSYINYKKLIYNANWIPCQHFYANVGTLIKGMWHEKLLIERLEHKTIYYNSLLDEYTNDWETLLYIGIAKYISPNVNRSQMEALAKRTPLRILLKHKDDLSHIEALLFGQSGLLSSTKNKDSYINQLQKDYDFFRHKYKLTPMDAVNWKFSKSRPAGFPTIRIAQLAQLIFENRNNFDKLINTNTSSISTDIFDVQASKYWNEHYQFGVVAHSKKKKMGINTIHGLFINVVAPIMFLYGSSKDDQNRKDVALDILSFIPAENNNVIRKWIELGEKPKNSFDSQALLELKQNYCSKKKCLSCAIGNAFMKKK